MQDFIKKRLQEESDYNLVESMIGEDYPSNWNIEEFKKLRSFSDRIKYCEANLRKVRAGSGRIVYIVDDTKVLKLAKNEKGIAQNEVEIAWGKDSYYEDILAHTFDNDENDLWVEMELARKVTPNIFKKIIGVDIYTFSVYLRIFEARMKGGKIYWSVDDDVKEMLDNSDFVNGIKDFIVGTDSSSGDLGRLSSYGLVNRGHGDQIVIVDFGLTSDVYASYYA